MANNQKMQDRNQGSNRNQTSPSTGNKMQNHGQPAKRERDDKNSSSSSNNRSSTTQKGSTGRM